jgi:hypothetical protein
MAVQATGMDVSVDHGITWQGLEEILHGAFLHLHGLG